MSSTNDNPLPENSFSDGVSLGNYMQMIHVFSGERNSDTSVREFFDEMLEIASLAAWPLQLSKMVLRTKLKGKALEFYRKKPLITRSQSIDDIAKIMISHFDDRGVDHDDLVGLLNCRQSVGETVKEFACRLEMLRSQVNEGVGDDSIDIGLKYLLKLFMEGLNDIIFEKMISETPTDFHNAVSIACNIEGKLRRLKRTNRNVMTVSTNANNLSTHTQPTGATKNDQTKPKIPLETMFTGEMECSSYVDTSQHNADSGMQELSDRMHVCSLEKGRDHRKINTPKRVVACTKCHCRDHDYDHEAASTYMGYVSPNPPSKYSSDINPHTRKQKYSRESPKISNNGQALSHYIKDARVSSQRTCDGSSNQVMSIDSTRRQKGNIVTDVIFCSSSVTALIDPAADQSLIANDIVEKFNLIKNTFKGRPIRIEGAGSGKYVTSQCIDLRFKFNIYEERLNHIFYIVDREAILGHSLILGSDILIPNNLILDTLNNRFKFGKTLMGHTRIVPGHQNSVAILYSSIVNENGLSMTNEGEVGDRIKGDIGSDQTNLMLNCDGDPLLNDISCMIGEAKPVCNRHIDRLCMLEDLIKELDIAHPIKTKLSEVITDCQDAFALDILDLGTIKGFNHQVKLTNNTPINRKQYEFPMRYRGRIKERLDQFMKAGIVERSISPWNMPIFAREKANGDIRLVLDATAVNSVTLKMDYPLVRIDALLSRLGKFKYFTVLDMESGFHQVNLDSASRQLFAFRTPWGKYQFKRMPMGAANSGFYFQMVMENVFNDMLNDNVSVFQDDILIASEDVDSHIRLLRKLLRRMIDVGIRVKIGKCNLMKSKVRFLGHLVSYGQITPDPSKISSIADFTIPKTVKGIRGFLGKVNFYSKFVPSIAELSCPLTNLLSKRSGKVELTDEARNAFECLKNVLTSGPVLRLPNYNEMFHVTTETSLHSIASVLEQVHDGISFPVAYYSRKLKSHECNYPSIERAALAVVAALDHYRYIIYGYPLIIRSEARAVDYLLSIKDGNPRLSSWATKIIKYAPYIIRDDRKETNMARILLGSEPHVDTGSQSDSQLVDSLDPTRVYTDGCCSDNGKEGARAGIGVYWGKDHPCNISCSILGRASNNRSELIAICMALSTASALGIKHLAIHTDSKYAISNAQNGIPKWEKNGWVTDKGKKIVNECEFKLLNRLLANVTVDWVHVPAHQGDCGNEVANDMAMAGAKMGAKYTVHDIILGLVEDYRRLMSSSMLILSARTKEVETISMFDIDKLRDQQNLDSEISRIRKEIGTDDVVTVKGGMTMYTRPDGVVYAKGRIRMSKGIYIDVDSPYVPITMRNAVLKQVHNAKWICHGGYKQTCRVLLEKYFWASFRSDILKFIKNCKECQQAGCPPRKSPIQEFQKPNSPYECVSMDIVGPLRKTINGNIYILNIVDIFSRHLTCVPIPDQKAITISQALENHLIARFGCPRRLLTDRGSNFCSDLMAKVMGVFGIKHVTTGPYRPQTNGIVERINQEIKKKLTHLCSGSSNRWDDKLQYAQFSYNNSINGSLGRAPNEIIFGRILDFPRGWVDSDPTDIPLQSVNYDYYLDLKHRLEEVVKEVSSYETNERRRRLAQQNKGRKLMKYDIGDLVLYRHPVRHKNRITGFKYKFSGPYRIISRVSDVSYDIREIADNRNMRTVRTHVDRIKRFIGPSNDRKNRDSGEYSKWDHRSGNDVDEGNLEQRCLANKAGRSRDIRKRRRWSDAYDAVIPIQGVTESGNPQVNIGAIPESNVERNPHFTRSKGVIGKEIFDRYRIKRGKIELT